jgi:hypothetical protein
VLARGVAESDGDGGEWTIGRVYDVSSEWETVRHPDTGVFMFTERDFDALARGPAGRCFVVHFRVVNERGKLRAGLRAAGGGALEGPRSKHLLDCNDFVP